MLTSHQLTYYKTFGFLILRDFLNSDEIAKINYEFESKLTNTLRSTTTPGHHNYVSWPNLGPDTPYSGSLLEDGRICKIAEQLLGGEIYGISCNSGSFVGETQWHPDCEDINFQSLKFAFYLQSLNDRNGALRFIPGSHRNPIHDELLRNNLRSENPGNVYAHICAVNPGDGVIFDARLWHGSSGGSEDRRLITLIYNRVPKSADEKEATLYDMKGSRSTRENLAKNTYETPGPEYHPQWLSEAQKDDRRQRWIDWMKEFGYMDK